MKSYMQRTSQEGDRMARMKRAMGGDYRKLLGMLFDKARTAEHFRDIIDLFDNRAVQIAGYDLVSFFEENVAIKVQLGKLKLKDKDGNELSQEMTVPLKGFASRAWRRFMMSYGRIEVMASSRTLGDSIFRSGTLVEPPDWAGWTDEEKSTMEDVPHDYR